jgi:integrase/recombinase XerD
MARRLPQTITRADYERVLAMASKRAPTGVRNAAMLGVMWDTGLRVSEVCALAPADLIRTGSNAPSLRVRRGKGGGDRYNLGVPAQTWALMERWAGVRPSSRWLFSTLNGNQLDTRYVRAMLARYSRRAGVHLLGPGNMPKPVHPHALRHSYATRLVEAGVPIHDVQRALGHAHLSSTEVYLHASDARLAAKLRAALDEDGGDTEAEAIRRIVRAELEAIIHAA